MGRVVWRSRAGRPVWAAWVAMRAVRGRGAAVPAHGRRRWPALYAAVACALIGWCAFAPAATGQAAPAGITAAGTPTTPTPAGGGANADAFATDRPVPPYQRGPDAWAWRATLPGARIILYYGIVGAPSGGVIGWYGGDEAGLLNQLRTQAQGYTQADPTHPVMMGLDVVNPGADALPQAEGLYIDRLDAATLRHYVDLTGQNHMLFFTDMQVGYSSVQRELTYLWPYLQMPWVHLAIDPEWDHSHNGQAQGCPGIQDNIDATGRAYASEINYLIDQLSALVTSRHLPPKILILHQYQLGENPANPGYICNNPLPSEGWQNIHIKPGVQLVVNTDGVGSPGAKASDYYLFDNVQRLQYPGIKLYYYYPILTPNFYDSPVMTPQQVLTLNPPPLLIMYQ